MQRKLLSIWKGVVFYGKSRGELPEQINNHFKLAARIKQMRILPGTYFRGQTLARQVTGSKIQSWPFAGS